MKVYLDTCSLQRPLDNKTQLRVLLESEAEPGLLAFGYGDFTSERDELFKDMTLDDMIAGIKQRRGQTATQPPTSA